MFTSVTLPTSSYVNSRTRSSPKWDLTPRMCSQYVTLHWPSVTLSCPMTMESIHVSPTGDGVLFSTNQYRPPVTFPSIKGSGFENCCVKNVWSKNGPVLVESVGPSRRRQLEFWDGVRCASPSRLRWKYDSSYAR